MNIEVITIGENICGSCEMSTVKLSWILDRGEIDYSGAGLFASSFKVYAKWFGFKAAEKSIIKNVPDHQNGKPFLS